MSPHGGGQCRAVTSRTAKPARGEMRRSWRLAAMLACEARVINVLNKYMREKWHIAKA